MDALKSIVVAAGSLVGGFLGYKLTGGWIGVPIGAIVVAFVGSKLLVGEFVSAVLAISVGAFALFHFTVSRAPDISKDALLKSGEGFTQPAIEFVATVPAAVASGAEPGPKKGAAQPAQQTASNNLNAAGLSDMQPGNVFRDCTNCPELVVMPAGQFAMGRVTYAPDADSSETPPHNVTIPSFAMGQDAVTRSQFSTFVTAANYQTDAERLGGCFGLSGDNWEVKARQTWRNPGFVQADNHPVVCVSWNDAQAYLQWLSALTWKKYRLPTEAEREYVTRAGSIDAYWWGNSVTLEQANFREDALGAKDANQRPWRKSTVPVRQFAANPFGLYNVHGNVREWVQDCQHNNYKGAPADGSAWTSNCVGTQRGVRGGGWVSPAAGLRAAQRTWFEPDLPSYAGGFRVVRELAK